MTLYDTLDKLGLFMGEQKASRVDYIESIVARVDLEALTPLERRWLKEAKEQENTNAV